jgi:hypothetical protein
LRAVRSRPMISLACSLNAARSRGSIRLPAMSARPCAYAQLRGP